MKKILKFSLLFVGVVILAFVIMWGIGQYRMWRMARNADLAVELINSERERITALQMADTYGGQTPHETLALYIAAVEKGDYDLASKYFVIEGQEKERNSFIGASKESSERYLSLLKDSLKKDGSYNLEKDYFSIEEPLMVDFIKYPNGIWKISEI